MSNVEISAVIGFTMMVGGAYIDSGHRVNLIWFTTIGAIIFFASIGIIIFG